MKSQINRRIFLKTGYVTGCATLLSGKLSAFSFLQEETPDPKKLNYCGYKCPDNCKLLEASVKNDPALKKEVYETWKMQERHNVDFDADKIFCFGCKIDDKPLGVVVKKCTVRQYAIERKMDACIECQNLKTCEKELWQKFPGFHNTVIKMQESYIEAKS
ncbi:DUF3795 domain-containing protein [Maribellus comscasis]|uniref:DUF3795 domain-containing protein n=1 Tax=Maribellus comscasis TaxID=2681766 RepID=A0A6I6JNF3_9BACT|nr:DUF3795 domain-containing protein [Maribellus comscasis]QGY42639.1 DUF3795 domain-containing protein [Maribellus comscasis]